MAEFRVAIIVFGLFFLFSCDALAEASKPLWKELKPQQQKILGPLAESWDAMESERKKKWLGVAKRYPKMISELAIAPFSCIFYAPIYVAQWLTHSSSTFAIEYAVAPQNSSLDSI